MSGRVAAQRRHTVPAECHVPVSPADRAALHLCQDVVRVGVAVAPSTGRGANDRPILVERLLAEDEAVARLCRVHKLAVGGNLLCHRLHLRAAAAKRHAPIWEGAERVGHFGELVQALQLHVPVVRDAVDIMGGALLLQNVEHLLGEDIEVARLVVVDHNLEVGELGTYEGAER